jgi:hypothetical protein
MNQGLTSETVLTVIFRKNVTKQKISWKTRNETIFKEGNWNVKKSVIKSFISECRDKIMVACSAEYYFYRIYLMRISKACRLRWPKGFDFDSQVSSGSFQKDECWTDKTIL